MNKFLLLLLIILLSNPAIAYYRRCYSTGNFSDCTELYTSKTVIYTPLNTTIIRQDRPYHNRASRYAPSYYQGHREVTVVNYPVRQRSPHTVGINRTTRNTSSNSSINIRM